MLRKAPVAMAILMLAAFGFVPRQQASPPAEETEWKFASSGDSRNCGDVVMPGIAASVIEHHALFYWHLGDLRAIYDFDEDMQHQTKHQVKPMTISEYEDTAWDDYIENQVVPFGSLPFFIGIGNHETYSPKTREQFITQFADWLDAPVLQTQRLKDNSQDHFLRAYYHWVMKGVDFIYLDNATLDQFDRDQMKWIEGVLGRDETDPVIKTVVVGMHRALPDSISYGHGMNESPDGTESGRRAYKDLLHVQNEAHKRVYVLASHSHYYMNGIFNSDYWRANGGVLPGWIVGTAGAVRYPLPQNWKDSHEAGTDVYGYLLATVSPDGEIRFDFQAVNEADIPSAAASQFVPGFVHWCFAENRSSQ
jgi:hypothetical protein